MADKKVTELAAATTPLAGTEDISIAQSGVSKQVNVSEFTLSADGSTIRVWKGTQTAYDLLTPASDTLYFITGP